MEIASGQVVEYLENQKFVVAAVLEQKGSRYRCLTMKGREVTLAPARLLHVSSQRLGQMDRSQLMNQLQSIHARREELKEQIDIVELWELVVDDQDEVWEPKDLAELAFSGQITPDHVAAMIRAVIDDSTYFKFRQGSIHVMSRVVVERLLEQRRREAERLERLSEGCRWLADFWGQESSSLSYRDEHVNYWIEAIKDVCLKGEDSPHYQEVSGLFRQSGLAGRHTPFETMVKAGIWHEDENLELLRNEIEIGFPPDVMEQARKIADTPLSLEALEAEGRQDLTDLATYTIDSSESRDLDDAISFEKIPTGWEIGIHISDIGLLIEPGTPLFEEAISRAISIYLPELQVPMMPEILSHEALSLHEGQLRRAISFMITVDSAGHILATQVVRSIIRVKRRLSYQEVDSAIELKEKWHELYQICKALQQRRIEKGALPLPIPELNISIEDDGSVNLNLVTPGPARFLVAECMILANTVGAAFLRDHRLPGLYRSQPGPRDRIIDGHEMDLLANLRQRRMISRGMLGLEPEPHAGLGVDLYTTVTSPLRRGLDLLMQQQIGSQLFRGRPMHSQEELERLSIVLKQGLATAAAVTQGTVRYWIIKYFMLHSQETFKAWVLEVGPRRITAVLQKTLQTFELPIPHGMKVRPDQEIEVRVKEAKPRENILRFEWANVGP